MHIAAETRVWTPARRPANEKERLAALERYAILDTEREQPFDDITSLIASVCRTPMAK
jgi:hypothetical protein